MNNKLWIAMGAALALAACGDDSGTKNPDLSMVDGMSTPTVNVTGFTFDADLILGVVAMHPDWTPAMIFDAAKNANAPIYGRYLDGSKTDTVMSDAMGNYSFKAKQGSMLQVVSDTFKDATHNNLATLTIDPVTVGTADVSMTAAHACTANMYSVTVGIANAAGITTDVELEKGLLAVGASPPFTPPYAKFLAPASISVSDSGFVQYQLTDPTTTPPTFVKMTGVGGPASGFIKDGVPAAGINVDVVITDPMSKVDFPAKISMPVIPGIFTFGGVVGTCHNGADAMGNCQ